MKITGGIAGGIPIQVLKGDRTRPTTDRIRESVFSRLQAFVQGKRVLDLFAGSGALGLDAASRGAASVVFVEQHAATANLILQNALKLAPAGVTADFRVLTLDAYRFLRNPAGLKVDLIFADPPYAYLQKEEAFAALLTAIHSADVLSEDGRLVVESGSRVPLPTVPGWTLTKEKTFGISRISFWELGG
ncbi:MAG: 16S rRNA (guanine(966)-N(2))-methyltransferase RsmD [Kiritimatiellia bacterium]